MQPISAFTAFEDAVRAAAPRVAVVLGSGIRLDPPRYVPGASVGFSDVPGLAQTSVAGHSGRISVGTCGTKPVLVFHGRLHFYEGHSWERVAGPVRLAAALGVTSMVLTNAAGGIRHTLGPGSLMLVRDHLSWRRPGDWRGPGPAGCLCPAGERPSPYSARLLALLQEVGREQGGVSPAGVYAALTGPCYETPAEIRALRTAGADAVGMSTAHEVEAAHGLGLECAAVSCITNQAAGLGDAPLSHQEVIDTARQSAERLAGLIARLIERMGAETPPHTPFP